MYVKSYLLNCCDLAASCITSRLAEFINFDASSQTHFKLLMACGVLNMLYMYVLGRQGKRFASKWGHVFNTLIGRGLLPV